MNLPGSYVPTEKVDVDHVDLEDVAALGDTVLAHCLREAKVLERDSCLESGVPLWNSIV
jgi:hypothetical protein